MADAQAPSFDPSDFDNDPYIKRVDKPWGYELHWVREGEPYIGKVLHINAGARLSLQVHDQKQESWFTIAPTESCRVCRCALLTSLQLEQELCGRAWRTRKR